MADPIVPNQTTTADRTSFRPQSNTTLSLIAGKLVERIVEIWQPHRIHEYLLAPDHRRQVWHCWLSSHSEISDPEHTYQILTQAKSADIVTDVYGCCPSGLISALGKLGAQARRKEFYAALCGVLKRGGPLARHVHHLKQISDETIFALAAVNDHPPSDRILKVLLKRSKPHQFAELTWIVSRLTLLLGQADVERSLVHGGNPSRSVERLIGQLPFPDPPFIGDPRLQPITTGRGLREIGKQLKNCLADRSTWLDAVIDVQAGRSYFYRWVGDQPAILSFDRFASLGWIPHQFEAGNNDVPSEITRFQVEQVLRQIAEVGPISMRVGYRF